MAGAAVTLFTVNNPSTYKSAPARGRGETLPKDDLFWPIVAPYEFECVRLTRQTQMVVELQPFALLSESNILDRPPKKWKIKLDARIHGYIVAAINWVSSSGLF